MSLPEPSPWFSLAIALLALVAPGIRWLYRRWFKTGRIEAHPTGSIEVGYGNLGPSIALQGTLQGIDRELFVREMSIQVTRDLDRAQHNFEWALFRSTRFVSTRPNEVGWALPSGFLLLPSQPFRFNIFFNDAAFRQQYVQPLLDDLSAAWTTLVQASLPAGPLPVNAQQAQAAIQHASQAAYAAFSTGAVHTGAQAELNQRFYWHAGRYQMKMTVATANRSFTWEWRFELSQANETALRLNSLKAVQETCGQYIGAYNFAYAHRLPMQ
jgi:hypothetical protein